MTHQAPSSRGSSAVVVVERRAIKSSRGSSLHTLYSKHSRRAGEVKRLLILSVLASSRLPVGSLELLARAQAAAGGERELPRRTFYYHLRILINLGYVGRLGRPRSPGVCYYITRRGLRFYRENSWRLRRGQFAHLTRWLVAGGCRRHTPVLGRLVWDNGELGVRVPWRFVRRVAELVAGRRVGSRLRRTMFYTAREGGGYVVHLDFFVVGDPDDWLSIGLYGVRDRLVSLAVVAIGLLKGLGWDSSRLLELVELAPVIEVA